MLGGWVRLPRILRGLRRTEVTSIRNDIVMVSITMCCRCFKLDRNTQGRGDSLAPRDGSSYFEKICLRGEVSDCRDKAWAFERVPNKMLQVNRYTTVHGGT